MEEKLINRAIKIRLYPTLEQQTFLNKSFGCARFFYNFLLNEKLTFYKNEIEPIKENKEVQAEKYKQFKPTTKKQFKEQFEFVKECSDDCLNSTERNLHSAFSSFFKGTTKFPKFHSKKIHRDSYKECHLKVNAFDFHNRKLNISKCTPIIFRRRQKLPKWYSDKCTLKSITVSKNPAGEYWASLLFELTMFYSNQKPISENQSIGLDWSPADFYINSDNKSGKDYGYVPQKQAHHKQLTKLQRKLARKINGSSNRNKARIKLAKLEQHIANSRKWWLENETLRLVRNYSLIGIEDLNLTGIAKFLRNAKNVNDCAYYTFTEKLITKGEETGTAVIKVDRYFPSSQICNCCGYQNHNLKLADRTWTCPNCGTNLVRDLNASINIRNEAIRLASNVPMRHGKLMSVEGVENTLALQALNIGAPVEAERVNCEITHKAVIL